MSSVRPTSIQTMSTLRDCFNHVSVSRPHPKAECGEYNSFENDIVAGYVYWKQLSTTNPSHDYTLSFMAFGFHWRTVKIKYCNPETAKIMEKVHLMAMKHGEIGQSFVDPFTRRTVEYIVTKLLPKQSKIKSNL
jgi:hypothetical protein